MSQTSFNQSTRAETRRHGVEARSESMDSGERNLLQEATVTAVTGDSYTVAVGLDPDAAPIEDPANPGQFIPAPPLATYTRVFCVPASELSVGQVVWLVFQPGVGDPVILSSGGGGGGSCASSINAFGVVGLL